MHVRVRHQTRYSYDVPVALGWHTLRLTPHPRAATLLRRELVVTPHPVQQWDEPDAWGNTVTRVAFSGNTAELVVSSQFEAETRIPAPIPAGLAPLPWTRETPANVDDAVAAFAWEVARDVGYDAPAFLERLCVAIYRRTERRWRLEGEAQTAGDTLNTRVGACRDVTVLYLEACRALGLHGYFVSGYQTHAESEPARRQLHAWPEIDLGHGQRWAWDPTHGTAVGDGHLALCAAPTQHQTMPVEGGFTFVGSTVNSTLTYEVEISVVAPGC